MHGPGKIRKAPDFTAMMAGRSRRLLGIVYRGSFWRWKKCGTCRGFFWRNCTRNQFRDNQNRRVYCSKRCQLEGFRVLNAARQARWRSRRRLWNRRNAPG